MLNNVYKILLCLLFCCSCSNDFDTPKKYVLKVKGIITNGALAPGEKYLFINNGKIAEVFSKKSEIKTLDVNILDRSEFYIMPGFIDTHTHVFLTDHTYDENLAMGMKESMQDKHRFDKAKRRISSLLENGFVVIRELGNSGKFLDAKLSLMTQKNKSLGPQIIYSGPGICVFPCQFDEKDSPEIVEKEYFVIKNISEGIKAIERVKAQGARWVKLYADNVPSKGVMKPKLFKALVEYAKKNKLKIAAHTIDKEGTRMAIESGVNSIEHVEFLSKEDAILAAKKNIYLVPTDHSPKTVMRMIEKRKISQNYVDRQIKLKKERLQNAFLNGVYSVFGSDYYFPISHDSNFGKESLETIMSYAYLGVDNRNIFMMLTKNAATLLGKSSLGEIRKGANATFILMKKNPLENLEHFFAKKQVYIDGARVR